MSPCTYTRSLILTAAILAGAPVSGAEDFSVIGIAHHTSRELELNWRDSRWFGQRVILHDRDGVRRERSGDTAFQARISQRGAAALYDLYPFGGAFRLTGGWFLNDHDFRLTARSILATPDPRLTALIKDHGVDGRIRYRGLSAYLGLGWGGEAGRRDRLRYSVDIGVLDHGTPDVTLRARGPLFDALGRAFPAELGQLERAGASDLRRDLEAYRLSPVATFSLNWRF